MVGAPWPAIPPEVVEWLGVHVGDPVRIRLAPARVIVLTPRPWAGNGWEVTWTDDPHHCLPLRGMARHLRVSTDDRVRFLRVLPMGWVAVVDAAVERAQLEDALTAFAHPA